MKQHIPKYWWFPSGCPYCGNDRVRFHEGSIGKGAILDLTFVLRPFSKWVKKSYITCCNCGKVVEWIPEGEWTN